MLYVKNNIDIDKLCENWEKLDNGCYRISSCCSDEEVIIEPKSREVFSLGYTCMISEWYNKGIIIEKEEECTMTMISSNNKIVCLCGSSRFKDKFFEAAEQLTLEGKIVLMPFVFTHNDGLSIDDDQLGELITLHKEKINMADIVYIITDASNYIGENTTDEIEYAKSLNKTVLYYYN